MNTDFRPKAVADDASGYEMMLRSDPLNVAYHNDLALLYLELAQIPKAVAHFQTVTELRPESAQAFFNLGTARMRDGQLEPAIAELRRSVELDPNYVAARINLGNTLAAQGAFDEAILHYRRALALDPGNAVVRDNLNRILALSERRSRG